MVRPSITYGAAIWHNRNKTGLTKGKEKRLDILQNKALRIVCGAYRAVNKAILESESFVQPMSLFLNETQDKATLRTTNSDEAQRQSGRVEH